MNHWKTLPYEFGKPVAEITGREPKCDLCGHTRTALRPHTLDNKNWSIFHPHQEHKGMIVCPTCVDKINSGRIEHQITT